MSKVNYVVKKATGEFLEGGHFDPNISIPVPGTPPGRSVLDPAKEIVVLDRHPDLRTDRWDGTRVVKKTAPEVTAWEDARAGEEYDSKLAGDAAFSTLLELLPATKQALARNKYIQKRRGKF